MKPANKSTKKVGSDEKNPLVDISPTHPGLIVVSTIGLQPSLRSVVRRALEYLMFNKLDKLPLPFPVAKGLLSVVSGNERKIEQAKAFAAASWKSSNSIDYAFKSFSSSNDFDMLSHEGRELLLPIVAEDDGKIITFEQEIESPISATSIDSMHRIRNVAIENRSWVIAFLSCFSGYKETRLNELCDDLIEVEECEPGPGIHAAFSIDCVGLSELGMLGHGKIMCNVIIENGKIRYKFVPFTSQKLEVRVMLKLWSQNITMDEIGKKFKVDKATVSRKLKGFSKPSPSKNDEQWLADCFELLGVDGDTPEDEVDFNYE